MSTRRVELKLQGYLVKSYRHYGGAATKWASGFQAGPCDLVCSMPSFGAHLVEAKHRPTWSKEILNPMTALQIEFAKDYIKGGSLVYLAIWRGGPKVQDTEVAVCNPLAETINPSSHDFFRPETGGLFPVRKMLEEAERMMVENHGWT